MPEPPGAGGDRDGLRPVARADLRPEARRPPPDRDDRDAESPRDGAVGEPDRDHLDHLELFCGEPTARGVAGGTDVSPPQEVDVSSQHGDEWAARLATRATGARQVRKKAPP